MTAQLYLASTSPRRSELLQQIGVNFETLQVDVDETLLTQEAAADYVQRLALAKARAGLEVVADNRNAVILGGDTAVVYDGRIFGKPVGREQAWMMLETLSGETHQVYSAVSAVNNDQQLTRLTVTNVTFHNLSAQQQQAYWETGEPEGKAGAYAVQGFGAVFVASIAGSYTGVVGLPVAETAELLGCFGVPVWTKASL